MARDTNRKTRQGSEARKQTRVLDDRPKSYQPHANVASESLWKLHAWALKPGGLSGRSTTPSGRGGAAFGGLMSIGPGDGRCGGVD